MALPNILVIIVSCPILGSEPLVSEVVIWDQKEGMDEIANCRYEIREVDASWVVFQLSSRLQR